MTAPKTTQFARDDHARLALLLLACAISATTRRSSSLLPLACTAAAVSLHSCPRQRESLLLPPPRMYCRRRWSHGFPICRRRSQGRPPSSTAVALHRCPRRSPAEVVPPFRRSPARDCPRRHQGGLPFRQTHCLTHIVVDVGSPDSFTTVRP
ncbi:hypothetical protein [Oryza sativa Japonica Group]|uniref:Os01g0540750 protein n=2 Tax=Oryza sativa subsp. japonica TaxID=39947 RepID=Q5JL89_ORYSJ|nr:hypothetical protein [Oryza sativa Japonica Group]BAS72562.1 Os01g0540750 [Oryza sativa Japonica Group]